MARRYLLLNSSIGYNVASISRGRGITICRGALLEQTTRNTYVYHQRGVLRSSKFKPSQLEIRHHITTDVDCKKLSQHQFELLSAISKEESRYHVYATDRLEWGCSLESGDDVFVKLRGVDKPVAATVCCKKEHGFGVEIKVSLRANARLSAISCMHALQWSLAHDQMVSCTLLSLMCTCFVIANLT